MIANEAIMGEDTNTHFETQLPSFHFFHTTWKLLGCCKSFSEPTARNNSEPR